MTEAYAAATTVSIPIFALAAGAEARTVRDRLRRPDQRWEEEFARTSRPRAASRARHARSGPARRHACRAIACSRLAARVSRSCSRP